MEVHLSFVFPRPSLLFPAKCLGTYFQHEQRSQTFSSMMFGIFHGVR
jgi:hypothetical protein